MPNRKTFDDREKYDHSQHSTSTPEKGDLAAVPGDERPREDGHPDSRGPGTTSKQTRNSR
jgi:hypothetical protein